MNIENALVRLPLLFDQANGRREFVLAEPGGAANIFIVRSIPAFTYGLGLNDCVRLLDQESGAYEVTKRGGQIVVRLYVDGSLDHPLIACLVDEVVKRGGLFEVARNTPRNGHKSLLLISLDVEAGFKAIESLMGEYETQEFQWEYGNVYDAAGKPLNWW